MRAFISVLTGVVLAIPLVMEQEVKSPVKRTRWGELHQSFKEYIRYMAYPFPKFP